MTIKNSIVLVAIAAAGWLTACGKDENVGTTPAQAPPGASGTEARKPVELPDDFPSDVAVYPGLRLTFASKLPRGLMVEGQSQDREEKIVAFYGQRMIEAGWVEEQPAGQPSGMRRLQYRKGGRTATIDLMSLGGPTTVQLTALTAD